MESIVLSVPKPEARWRYGKTYPGNKTLWQPWIYNKICKGYGDLMGGLLSQGSPGAYENPHGTVLNNVHQLYIAVGSGNSDWDTMPLPTPPGGGETALIAEIARKGASVVGYVPDDATITTAPIAGNAVPAPTVIRRPVFTSSWSTVELVPATIREVGLFGGRDSTTALGAVQYLIGTLRFAAITKDSINPYTLTWQVELWINFE
jgi:hypothetical protein